MVVLKYLVIGTLLLRGVLSSCEFTDDFDFDGTPVIHHPVAIKNILERINNFRSKFASGEFSKSEPWAKDFTLVANMHEISWSRLLAMPHYYANSKYPDLVYAKCVETERCRDTMTWTTEGAVVRDDPQKLIKAIISGDALINILTPPGKFSSIEQLCRNATSRRGGSFSEVNVRGEFLCHSLNPLVEKIGCFVARVKLGGNSFDYYLWCHFCAIANQPTPWSESPTAAADWIQSGVPCSGCYEKRCSNEYFGLCSSNSSYEPVPMNLTTLVYVNKTYPTIPQRQTRIRRNRHLVRKVVKQRLLWADVYGPDFAPNPLFMLYKTTKSKSTATVIPPTPSMVEIDVPGQQPQPQPSELPKLEEPKPSLVKPIRKHNPIGHKDHPLKKYFQPDYSSGLISLGTEEESKDCLKQFRMFQKCGGGTAERVHLNYLLAFVCALFVFLF